MHRARNAANSALKYVMDPVEQYQLQTAIEDEGLDLGAIYHSHTRSDPIPSETDRLSPFVRTLRVHGDGPYYQTCNIVYPRELLERVGGFDADTYPVPGGEDTDLAFRAIEAGAPTAYAEKAQVYHAVSEIGGGDIRESQAGLSVSRLAHALLLVLVDHVVHARVAGAARLAEGDLRAREVLELDGHVLEDVPEPGAAVLGQTGQRRLRRVLSRESDSIRRRFGASPIWKRDVPS